MGNVIKCKKCVIALFNYNKEEIINWFDFNKYIINEVYISTNITHIHFIFHIHIAICFFCNTTLKQWKKQFSKPSQYFMRMKYRCETCSNYIAGKKKDHREEKKLILDFNPPVVKELSPTNQFYVYFQQRTTYNNVRELLGMRKYSACIDYLQKVLDYQGFRYACCS